MGITVDINSVTASVDFDIIPDFGVGDLGIAFDVGPISFGLGLLMGVKGKIELDTEVPIQYTAAVTITKPVECGIDYSDSTDLTVTPYYASSTGTVNAKSSWSQPDSVKATLVFHIVPTLTVGLEGSFVTYSEAIKLMVSVSREL